MGRTTFVGEDEGAETLELQVPMVREAQALYPELRVCSFDRGFSQPRSALVSLTNRIATVSARRELSYRPLGAMGPIAPSASVCTCARESVKAPPGGTDTPRQY